MADEYGAKAYSMSQQLQERACQFDFFQVVRRLECLRDNLPRVGLSRFPDEDIVLFRQQIELSFAHSSISSYKSGGPVQPGQLWVNFMGLLGPNGPMPLYLTEYIRNRLRNFDDKTLASFLDIFNHRMISLFYRAWAANQPVVSFDRPGEDYFSRFVGSFFGIGTASFRDRDNVEDLAKLYYSGRLIAHSKNAEGLQAILNDYFEIPTEITQFVGQWKTIPKRYRCNLGKSRDTGLLAETLVVGSRYWECQEKFRLKLGPMSFESYSRFIPGGENLPRLIDWIRNYTGDEFSWEVQLVLLAREVPDISLGQSGKLGFTTWLKTRQFTNDADNLTLSNLVA